MRGIVFEKIAHAEGKLGNRSQITFAHNCSVTAVAWRGVLLAQDMEDN